MTAVIVDGAITVDTHGKLAAVIAGGTQQPPGAARGGVDIYILAGAIHGCLADASLLLNCIGRKNEKSSMAPGFGLP